MGYSTDFEGTLTIDRPVDEETYRLLYGLATTRRMARDVAPEFGTEGEFYVDGSGPFGQGRDDDIIDHNRPPATQPGLWCQWLIQDDRQTIQWDGGKKFYHYVEWLEYLIGRILYPRGYVLNGRVRWQGERDGDSGTITVSDNCVSAVTDTEATWEKATDIRWDIMCAKGPASDLEASYDELCPQEINNGIREWYMNAYPEDSNSARIREDVTFADLDDAIDTGKPLAAILGHADENLGSPVTRRCMARLAEMWGIDYADLHGKWISRI